MNRVVRLTVLFRRACSRLDLAPQSERGKAMGRTIATLVNAKTLPGPVDSPVLFRSTTRAFVRRVSNRNLWLWYRLDDAASEITLVDISTEPPVPHDS